MTNTHAERAVAHVDPDDVYGYDAAFNYQNGPAAEQLAQAAPDGIDVFFDNVGGEDLEAAIGALKLHARIALCGGENVGKMIVKL